MISLDNLTVSYGGWTLFDNISFLINPKDRIGLVGRNGAGKTTLLRIITGEQQPTSGSVTLNGDCTIGYLPQTMRVADTTTLVEETAKAFEEVLRLEAEIEHLTREIAERTDYESDGYAQLLHRLNDAQDHYHILGGETRDADIEKTLLGLGFKREDFGRPTSEFSGGWRMRIELAKLLLRRPSIFLLDEPTNHLDIESIQWLEDYLKNYSGAVLLISHDRAFLDNVTNRTVELSLGKATDYKVSYSKYVVLRAERRAQQMAAYENQQRMIEKTEEFIEKFRYKPTKSNQVQSRIKQLERLERLEVEEEDLATLNIKFPPAPRSGQIVAEIDPLDFKWEYEAKKASFQTAEAQLQRAKKLLSKQAISKQEYESTEASYSNAKAAFEYAQNTLNQTKLRAPFDGFIQKKYVENYQKVQAGQGIVCLINPNKLQVVFTMPESNINYFSSPYSVYVEFDNYKGVRFKAKVKEYVEASPDGSGVPVYLYIDDPNFNLEKYKVAVGFSCRVILNVDSESFTQGAVLVPLAAVVADDANSDKYVFVYNGQSQKVERRKITESMLIGKDGVIVTDGLRPGEQVVSAGATRLVDGQQVKVLTD